MGLAPESRPAALQPPAASCQPPPSLVLRTVMESTALSCCTLPY